MEKPNILPDTNTILRYLLRDNEEHYEKANNIFEDVRVGTQKAIILEGVLLETLYVLIKFYKVPKKEAVEKLGNILNYKGITNNDKEELLTGLNIFSEKNIDFVDCILYAKARSYGYKIFSFDKDLQKLTK